MRKSIDQLWHESVELTDEEAETWNQLEVLVHERGEEIRGGDRPFAPLIYESHTKRSRSKTTTFFERLGF